MRKLFTQIKGKIALNRLSDDQFVQMVLEELKSKQIDEVAMAQAKIDADGDPKKVEGLYIKNRVRRIKDTENFSKAVEEAEAIKRKAKEWGQKISDNNHDQIGFDEAFSDETYFRDNENILEEIYSREQKKGIIIVLILCVGLVFLATSFAS